jgi:hypothetical protein
MLNSLTVYAPLPVRPDTFSSWGHWPVTSFEPKEPSTERPAPLPAISIPHPAGLPPSDLAPLIKDACVKVWSGKCYMPGCVAPYGAAYLCTKHRKERRATTPCIGPSCTRAAVTRGLCATHYQQTRAGLPLAPIRTKGAKPPPARKPEREPTYRLGFSIPSSVMIYLSTLGDPLKVAQQILIDHYNQRPQVTKNVTSD